MTRAHAALGLGTAGDATTGLSRRDAIRRMGVAGVGAGLAVHGAGRAAAQEAGTPVAGQFPPVIQTWIEVYNGRDSAAMAALYTADGIYEDVPNDFAAQGPGIAPFLATAEGLLSDVRIEVTGGFGNEVGAVVEYLFYATNEGLIPVPGTTGKAFVSRALTVFELADGKIRRSADYYDLVALLTQLGVMEPMQPGAIPPAATPIG